VQTVLIVDDNAGFRSQIRALLEADGFSVVGECADGASVMQAARAHRPDLVLLDIGLPDVLGFEVARELAAEEAPPMVVLTSSREAAAYGPGLVVDGVAGFIAKDELSGPAIRALAAGA
jgi:DNA-binding NarL/FixJ family response regulator